MSSIGGIASTANATLLQLAQSYLANERAPLTRLQANRSALTTRTTGFQDLKSKLQALRTAVDDFRLPGSLTPLGQYRAIVSDATALTATVTGAADEGTHAIAIDEIARAHSVAGIELSAGEAFDESGSFEFSITQDGVTHGVTVELVEGLTAREALTAVARAINASGAPARASVVTTDALAGRVRLLLTSTATGTPARLSEIADVTGELASLTGITGSSSAEVFSENTVQAATDASLRIDGLALISASNTVQDVLPGVTLTLLRATDAPVALTVKRDGGAVRSSVQGILDAYNAVVDFVRAQTRAADADGTNRGPLTGNATFMTLRRELRTLATDPVDGLEDAAVNRLSELGIRADGTGKLTLADPEALDEALSADPAAVERLFADAQDGVAVRLVAAIDRHVQVGGAIARETDALQSRGRVLDQSIARLQERLARREQTLLNELNTLQSMLDSLNAQQSTLNQMLSGQ
jgi:flagellar hook-associated protein 2